jgi:hypothetical protein
VAAEEACTQEVDTPPVSKESRGPMSGFCRSNTGHGSAASQEEEADVEVPTKR